MLAPGTRLGVYEILAPIGAGGMGEVYKARDTRLDRTVAVKVLPSDVADDPGLRARFEREARVVAALEHPHICPVYDVGHHEGVHFLVMQYLDGETLADRLAMSPRGLPLSHILMIGAEIATALEKSHRAGIVHRDVKPANIMLTKEGTKLLDFGLAKLRPSAPISMSAMTRMATPTPGTASGTIVGTVQYMAPEQVEGREADARADIWALGAVLYEMITGHRPFDGDTAASVIGAILKDHPPPASAHQPLTPAALDHVIAQCLAKDPDDRWQSASDVRLQLKWIETSGGALAPGDVAGGGRKLVVIAACGLVVIGAAAAVLWSQLPRGGPTQPVVTTVARVTHEAGFSEWPTWAPDGSLYAFTPNRNGNFEVYVGRVEGGQEVVNVTSHAADDVQPAFSPDGKSIAFVSTRSSPTGLIKVGTFIGFDTRTHGGDVWLTSALGGQARRLAAGGNFVVWHPDGRSVFYVGGPENHRAIMRVSVDGGVPTPVLPSRESTWEITRLRVSPDARWITFETPERQILAMPAAGGRPAWCWKAAATCGTGTAAVSTTPTNRAQAEHGLKRRRSRTVAGGPSSHGCGSQV